MADLKRQLGLLDSTMINVGTIIAVASIAGLTVLNSLGVRLGAVTQNVLTLTKIGLVIVLIVVGFVLPGGSVANLAPLWSDAPLGKQIASFGVALVAVLWAYDGWIEVTYVGSEVKDPERNMPRSIILSTFIAIALYCLVTASDRKSTRLDSSH